MQINKFDLYSMNLGMNNIPQNDEVDSCIQDVRDMNVYEDIKTYLTEHFGDFNGEKWVKYPELRKELFLRLDDDRIEVCALKNEQQYFGQGWLLINKNEQ